MAAVQVPLPPRRGRSARRNPTLSVVRAGKKISVKAIGRELDAELF